MNETSTDAGTKILGYTVDVGGLQDNCARGIASLEADGRPFVMACLNPHSYIEAKRDGSFRKALEQCDSLVPDGAGIVLAARILGRPIHERVAGFEYFLEFSRLAHSRGNARYFFLGSSDEVLSRIVDRVRIEFPAVDVCGTYSPPFKDEFNEAEIDEMIAAIARSHANVLWVGMTAPKQEKWIAAHRDRLPVRFIGAIGAVFDFYAGTKKRAPGWVRNLGLEWLPRLLREPRRLFRRNFVSSPLFLIDVLKARLGG